MDPKDAITLRPFSAYSDIEKDELRKQGLRTLTYAYKYGKQCTTCGWSKIRHLWLSSRTELEAGKTWIPLDRVPQAKVVRELEKRTLICAACRRIRPIQGPQYEWFSCKKKEPCAECGLTGLGGWCRQNDQTGPAAKESQRCIGCKKKFDKRVRLAKEFNQKSKHEARQCASCEIKVSVLGSAAFDWDHLDQTAKSGNIGSMTMAGDSIHAIKEEIRKCRLLCVYCHIDWTQKQLGYCDPLPKIECALEKARVREFNLVELDLFD